MSGYGAFSAYYDLLTRNVDYPARAAFYSRLLELHSKCRPLLSVLDLACGTGSLTLEFAGLGYDMIGVDASLDMLSGRRPKWRTRRARRRCFCARK